MVSASDPHSTLKGRLHFANWTLTNEVVIWPNLDSFDSIIWLSYYIICYFFFWQNLSIAHYLMPWTSVYLLILHACAYFLNNLNKLCEGICFVQSRHCHYSFFLLLGIRFSFKGYQIVHVLHFPSLQPHHSYCSHFFFVFGNWILV